MNIYFPAAGKKLQLSCAKQQKVKEALFKFDGVHDGWHVPEAVANCTTGFVKGPGKEIF